MLSSEQKNEEERISLSLSWAGIKRHFRPFKLRIVLISFLGVLSAIANGFTPFVTGKFFDELILISAGKSTSSSFPAWMFFLLIWVIVEIVANTADWINDRIERKTGTEVHLGVTANGFSHMMKLPLSFHKNEKINKLLEEISSTSWRLSTLFTSVATIIPQLLSLLVGIILAATINIPMAFVLMIGVALYSLILAAMIPKTSKYDIAVHEEFSKSWDMGAAANQQIESVKQAVAEVYEERQLKDSFFNEVKNVWLKMDYIWSNIGFFQRILVFLTRLIIFIISVNFVAKGVITVGELVALNGYAAMFFGPFVQLGHSWQYIQNGFVKAGGVERIFTKATENYNPKDGIKKEIEGEIEFDHVHFRYEPDQPDVLRGVSFKVRKGEVIALVGESGSGKSTAISLISAYYFPNEGLVKIDEIDTRKLYLSELRGAIAVVPQEIALCNDTIANNIRYGSFAAQQSAIEQAAKEAHIHEFIESLPETYETLVGDRGIKLSVGQKQRVAIARAILRNPKILILDEPTSALDAHTEQLITESLERLMTGRTTFIIAHRLSTVRKADRIFVFDKGQVAEEGKHTELIEIDGGVYQKLYTYQIGLH